MTKHKKWFYPFTAIVGQENLKIALLSAAINPLIGGVLLRGERGTGKSTAARALADLLPEIEVVKGCPFNCNPRDTAEMCEECAHKYERGEDLPAETKKMKVVDLPLSATEDRVVGSLNVEKALKEGTACLEPGLLAEANRGILYVDEVNLLDDHLVDILLDSAAMGLNVVEREGVSVSHPARFILIGTMNPEEGELRPQITDRFGLCVQIEALRDLEQRKEIVRRREAFERNPQAFQEKYNSPQKDLQERIIKSRKLLNQVEINEKLLENVSKLCLDLNIHTHRADIVIVATAKALAALEGRIEVTMEDITRAAKLALPHRFRRLPFEEIESKEQELEKALHNLPENLDPPEKQERETEKKAEAKERGTQSTSQDLVGVAGKAPKKKISEIGGPINVNKILNMALNVRKPTRGYGKRFSVPSSTVKGRYIKPGLPQEECCDIAVDASMRAAALRLARNSYNHEPFAVSSEDLRVKLRKTKSSSLIILVVDSSGSMNVYDRIEAAKGVAYSILTESYPKRDYVGIIMLKSSHAEVIMPPTKHLILGKRYLKALPSTGKTPLAAGLYKALIVENERTKIGLTMPIIVIISDGHANVPLSPKSNIEKELGAISKLFFEKGIHLVAIDTERIPNRFASNVGYMKMIAENAQGSYYNIDEVTASAIENIIQNEKVNLTKTIEQLSK